MTKKEFTDNLRADWRALVDKYENARNEMNAAGEPLPEYALFMGVHTGDALKIALKVSDMTIENQWVLLDGIRETMSEKMAQFIPQKP